MTCILCNRHLKSLSRLCFHVFHNHMEQEAPGLGCICPLCDLTIYDLLAHLEHAHPKVHINTFMHALAIGITPK